nr:M23 family metallopeptidase [Scatolibacter rhodanostii]
MVKQYLRPQAVKGGFIWPVPSYYGKDWITSTFGGRYNPVTGAWENAHGAIDIGAPGGTPIYAAADGDVIIANWVSGYGNCVKIRHDDTYSTLYGHSSKLLVTNGQQVKQGDIIALVGTTGQSTGNHLHFEVLENEVKIDPMQFF